MTQVNRVALVISPQGQYHIGHHHHQRGALGDLLVQPEKHTQYRNCDQPAANPEQTTHRAQGHAQDQVQH